MSSSIHLLHKFEEDPLHGRLTTTDVPANTGCVKIKKAKPALPAAFDTFSVQGSFTARTGAILRIDGAFGATKESAGVRSRSAKSFIFLSL